MDNQSQPSRLIDFLCSLDTPTLANAIELLSLRPHHEGFTPVQIRSLFPDLGRMCGYAVTAQVETVTTSEKFDIARFVELYRAIEGAPKPAVIVLQEVGAHPEYAAHCGEVMATVFTRLKAVGLVSDCAVRDIPEVRALGFHYFAQGAVASHANFRIVRTGVPVQIHGMVVHPGDLLHGDVNGLISVPTDDLATLANAVEQIRSREKKMMDWVRSKDFSLELFESYVVE